MPDAGLVELLWLTATELFICNQYFNERYFTQDLLRLMVSSMPAHPGTFFVLTQRLEC